MLANRHRKQPFKKWSSTIQFTRTSLDVVVRQLSPGRQSLAEVYNSSRCLSFHRGAARVFEWRFSSSRGVSVHRVRFQFVAWGFSSSRDVSVRRVVIG